MKARVYRNAAVLFVGFALLGGCAVTDSPQDAASGETARQPEIPAAPAEAAKPAAAGPREVAVRRAAPRPKRKPLVFSVRPERLINLEEQEIRDMMGDPPAVREQPPAIIWSYTRGGCRLDLYLYQSLKTRQLRSLTYVMEPTGDDPAAAGNCRRHGRN